MRIAFAGFHIESVSFLSQETSLATFEAGAARHHKILRQYWNTNTVPGGVLQGCDAAGADIIPIVYAYQGAVGPASDEAVEHYVSEICDALQNIDGALDGLILHLHGAAVSPSYRDVEGHFIERARATIGNDMPFVVAFDYHGNLSPESIACLDAAVAYKTSPHIDMGETGIRAVRWMERLISAPGSVSMSIVKPKVVVPSVFSATTLEPLQSLMHSAAETEAQSTEALDISIMAGFSYADTSDTGFSVIVVGQKDPSETGAIAQDFGQRIWQQRHALLTAAPVFSMTDAIDYVEIKARYSKRPIVLLEHADRMNDSTHLLAALLDKGLKNIAVPFLWDEKAVMAANDAGVGRTTDLEIGAWSSRRAGRRLKVRCKILQTGHKSFRISGPMLTGQEVDLGDTALIDIDGVIVSLVSRFAFAVDEDAFSIFGLRPQDFDVIVLRSKTHFRAVYEEIAEEIVIVDTPDWGTSELKSLPYRFLDKSNVYPLWLGDEES
jgi:microcystin degradation protein MlrC